MKYTAKKIGTIYEENYNMVEYEYRGHTYEVMFPKNWTLCVSSPKIQHEDAQKKIDDEIARDEAQKERTIKYEDTADYALDKFFEYVNE